MNYSNKVNRQYNKWVKKEEIEDFGLRYTPKSFRNWPELLIANTAIGSISFLALEAIGAGIAIQYGFLNAFLAILVASIILFFVSFPIAYYTSKYNIDIDLLTRSTGFGYVGSTITSLIYASFSFIFFALEAAIMAQALELYFNLSLGWGYLFSSLVILPLAIYGISFINKLQLWSQPIWIIMMIAPFIAIILKEPEAISSFINFTGSVSKSSEFNIYYFGFAMGVSLSLIGQIGEQVDYLRFMPQLEKRNRFKWWISVIFAGPGWIILGFLKQIGGIFLAGVVLLSGLSIYEAKTPIQMYYVGYQYIVDNTETALLLAVVFVIISQIKINVTNAYAGSLAWSNFFSRVTHSHPGRIVWVFFNIGIALLLMELGVFDVLEKVLGLYSNVAIAWIATIAADLLINKPLGLSPKIIEFKRAHLYDYNPVGFGSMGIASIISILAFTGIFGYLAQSFSSLIALILAFILTPSLAILTKAKYYIARENKYLGVTETLHICKVCNTEYETPDITYCPYQDVEICTLCCSLDTSCRDICKIGIEEPLQKKIGNWVFSLLREKISVEVIIRTFSFIGFTSILIFVLSVMLWMVYEHELDGTSSIPALESSLTTVFVIFSIFTSIFVWWILLLKDSSKDAEDTLNKQKRFVQTLIDSQDQIIITTDGEKIVTANETFLGFFTVKNIEEFMKKYNARCICDTFNTNAPEGYLQIKMGRESWIDYVISHSLNETHKAMISIGNMDFIFSVNAAKLPGDEGLKSAVFTNITEMEKAKQDIEAINKHTRESIEYASLIQTALIPDNTAFKNYFSNYFTIWHPKDIVGGDIYLFEELRDKDECLLMVIDCTGHGVPGAFVTMLVKAIERQVIAKINSDEDIDVSPAWILSYFNRTMKKLLQQESEDSISNAGFDGGIIYYNKKEKIIKFSGAETPLFYTDENNELKTIKGSRHSIGYRKSNTSFEFKEHSIDVKEGMKFYLTTDGYIDQNGGEKGFPFGKKRFKAIIEEYNQESMTDQQEVFLSELERYQSEEERNDDVTLVGFKI